MRLSFLMFSLFFAFQAEAAPDPSIPSEPGRVVNSRSDRERLLGWDEQQRLNREFEKERRSDVGDLEKERRRWNQEQARSLKEYRVWKKREAAILDESSPEYRADQEQRRREKQVHEKERDDFVARRDRERQEARSTVKVTERQELGIDRDPARVDWNKRNLLGDKKVGASNLNKNGGASGAAPRSNTDFIPPEFDQPPPPPPPTGAPPPEFFEPDIPPMPPPVPEGGFDTPVPPGMPSGEGLPPPPPPIFDDEF